MEKRNEKLKHLSAEADSGLAGWGGDEGGVGSMSVLSGQAWEKETCFRQKPLLSNASGGGARDTAGRVSTVVFTYSVKRAISLAGLLQG